MVGVGALAFTRVPCGFTRRASTRMSAATMGSHASWRPSGSAFAADTHSSRRRGWRSGGSLRSAACSDASHGVADYAGIRCRDRSFSVTTARTMREQRSARLGRRSAVRRWSRRSGRRHTPIFWQRTRRRSARPVARVGRAVRQRLGRGAASCAAAGAHRADSVHARSGAFSDGSASGVPQIQSRDTDTAGHERGNRPTGGSAGHGHDRGRTLGRRDRACSRCAEGGLPQRDRRRPEAWTPWRGHRGGRRVTFSQPLTLSARSTGRALSGRTAPLGSFPPLGVRRDLTTPHTRAPGVDSNMPRRWMCLGP